MAFLITIIYLFNKKKKKIFTYIMMLCFLFTYLLIFPPLDMDDNDMYINLLHICMCTG